MDAARQAAGRRRRRAALWLVLLGLLAAAGYAAFPFVRAGITRGPGAAAARRDFVAAHDHFVRALEDRPGRADLHLLAARAARRADLYQAAVDHLTDCQRLLGPDDSISLERAMLAAQKGELTADGESYLRRQADSDSADAVLALEALSRNYCKARRFARARVCLDQWLKREPDAFDALLLRGWVAERQKRLEDAATDYRRAVALVPGHQEARLRLAQMLLAGTHQTDEATAIFERLWQEEPGRVEVGIGLAQCRVLAGRPEEAARLLDGLLEHDPEDATLLIERGKLALATGDLGAARGWLEKAVARAPYHFQANYALSRCLSELGESAGAERALARARLIEDDFRRLDKLIAALQERPSSPDLRTQIGEIFLRHGEEDEGAFWLKSALEADPDYEPARRLLAGADRHAKE